MNRPLDIQKLKSTFLECNICYQAYDEDDHHPRVFNCLHGACFSCVKTLVKNEKLKCHVCRIEYSVPNNDVKKSFLKDFTRRDLLNFVQVQEPSAVIVCDSCLIEDTKKHAINRCKACAEFLCKECSDAHRKVKATREHQLFELEQFKNNFNYKDFWFEGQCPEKEHEQEKLILYCKNEECQVPLCLRCAFLKHQGHNTENINIVFEEKKQLLEEKLTELGTVTCDRQHHLKKLEIEIRNLNTNVEQSQKDMDNSFEKCQTILEERRQEHNRTLINIKKSKYKIINQQQLDIDAILEQTKQSCEFAQQALDYRNPSAFLLIEKTISERLQRLIEIVYDSYPHQTSFVQFDENRMVPIIERAARNLGCINCTSSFLPNTKVKFPPIVTRNSPLKIQIQLYDHDGNDVTRENAKLTVEVSNGKSPPQQIEAAPSIDNGVDDWEEDAGKIYEYEANYDPTVSGKHDFTVSLFGIEIPETYHFVVKEDRTDPKEENIDDTLPHQKKNHNFLEFLKQKYLQCVLCKEAFDEQKHFPRLMKCLHQIGDSCLKTKVKENTNGKLECPECYESYVLDEGLSERYPRNFTWRQLNDFIFAREPDKHLEADCCDSKKQISYWCKECASFMCEVCKKAHRQLLTTKWHTLLELKNDLSLEPDEVVDFRHMTTCTERDHQNERLPIFCCDCKKALCILCVITHNCNNELGKECHKLNIKVVYEEKTNETMGNISALYDRLQGVNDIIRNVKDEDEAVDMAADKAKDDINEEFEMLVRTLNERRQQLLSTVEIEREEKKAVLKKQLEDLQFHKRIILDNLDTSELALKFKDAPAFLLMHDVINERLNHLTLTPKDTRPHTSAQIKFAMSLPDADCKEYFPKIGFIDSTSAYLPSSVFKLPEAVFENTDVPVTVSLYDSNGECAKGITSGIRLKVSTPDNRTELITAQTNLRYTWKPKTAGNHELCVCLQDGTEESKSITCLVQKDQITELPKKNEKNHLPTPSQPKDDKNGDTCENPESTEKKEMTQPKEETKIDTSEMDAAHTIQKETQKETNIPKLLPEKATPSTDKDKQSSDNKTKPLPENTKPPAGNTKPPAEKTKPAPENTKPSPENTKPAPENSKPPAEKSKPPTENIKPPAEKPKPPPETTKPSPENSKPLAEKSKPSPENTKPAPENSKPPAEKSKPPAEKTKPPTENTKPPAEKPKPSPETTKPSPENSKPLAEKSKPPLESTKQPAEKSKPPTEKSKPPPENTKPPAEKSKPPPENNKPPAEKSKPPPENTKQPAEKSKPPPENTKPPAEKSKPPPENNKPPPENTKPPVEKSKPPSENTKPSPENSKPLAEKSKPPPENTKPPAEK